MGNKLGSLPPLLPVGTLCLLGPLRPFRKHPLHSTRLSDNRSVNSEMLSVTVKKTEESILFDFEQMTLKIARQKTMWSLGVQAAAVFIALTLTLIPLSNGSN